MEGGIQLRTLIQRTGMGQRGSDTDKEIHPEDRNGQWRKWYKWGNSTQGQVFAREGVLQLTTFNQRTGMCQEGSHTAEVIQPEDRYGSMMDGYSWGYSNRWQVCATKGVLQLRTFNHGARRTESRVGHTLVKKTKVP
jgi:hypothetical protein